MYGSFSRVYVISVMYAHTLGHTPSPALASHFPSLEKVNEFTHELCIDSFLQRKDGRDYVYIFIKTWVLSGTPRVREPAL